MPWVYFPALHKNGHRGAGLWSHTWDVRAWSRVQGHLQLTSTSEVYIRHCLKKQRKKGGSRWLTDNSAGCSFRWPRFDSQNPRGSSGTPVQKGSSAFFSGLRGHCIHKWYTYIHEGKTFTTHKIMNKLKKMMNQIFEDYWIDIFQLRKWAEENKERECIDPKGPMAHDLVYFY